MPKNHLKKDKNKSIYGDNPLPPPKYRQTDVFPREHNLGINLSTRRTQLYMFAILAGSDDILISYISWNIAHEH